MNNVTKPAENPLRKAKSRANLSFTFALVAMIGMILLAIVCWYVWTQIYVDKLGWQKSKATVQTELAAQKDHLQVNTKVLQTQLNQQQQVIQSMQVNLQNALSSMRHNKDYQIINQVSYLVHQANLDLMISHNPQQAISLLDNAKKLLDQLSDPLLFSLKKSIDKDMAALAKTTSLDVSGLLAKLDGIDALVAKIPSLPVEYTPSSEPASKVAIKVDNQTWGQKFAHLLAGFKNLVVIRHHPKPIHALLSAQQLQVLKQNISLKVAMAQWAIINRNQAVYQESLQQVTAWLQQELQDPASVADLLNSLKQLSTVNIVPSYPDLSRTLSALNYYLKQSLQLPIKKVMIKDQEVIKSLTKKSPKLPVKLSSLSHNAGMEI